MAERRPFEHGKPTGRRSHLRRGEKPCDECRLAWNAECREVQARKRARDREAGRERSRTKYALTCERCGRNFASVSRAQRFCSQWCWGQSPRVVKSTALVHVGPVIPSPHRFGRVEPVDITSRKPRLWFAGPCGWCGADFTFNQPQARFCSKQCSRRWWRAKRDSRFRIAPKLRLAVYERDGWICQLCSEPVDRDAHYLDDRAPSLDHIECQSWVLIPDHSPENLRLACRICNSKRGDETWLRAA